jgi:hypothetical protein
MAEMTLGLDDAHGGVGSRDDAGGGHAAHGLRTTLTAEAPDRTVGCPPRSIRVLFPAVTNGDQ